MAMNDLSATDVLALRNNGSGDFGGNDGILWLLLFIVLGGFGNRGWGNGGGYGAGGIGGNELYPWLNQSEQVSGGFRDQMLATGVQGIQQGVTGLSAQLCDGFSATQQAVAGGFSALEASNNARQVANMQQGYANQTAMLQGFNSIQAQQAQCCCDNQLAMANQTATILAENCADRAALSDATRDLMTNQNAGVQRIIDKLCDQELQAERRENDNLRQQLAMSNLAASQTAQTAQILADNARQTSALEQYLNPAPIPAYMVQNPNCCQQPCGCGFAA